MDIIDKKKTTDGLKLVGGGFMEVAYGCNHIVKGTGMVLIGTVGHMIGGAAVGIGRITKETAKGFVNGVKPNKTQTISNNAKPAPNSIKPEVFQAANAPTA